MFGRAAVVALTMGLTPLSARGADLVVWWEKGQYAQEDEAVREIIAAFEQSGRQVELVLDRQEKLLERTQAAIEAGRPPDFIFTVITIQHYEQWAYEGRLVDLSDVVSPFLDLFDREALQRAALFDSTMGRRGLYMLPMGLATHHVHAWKSLLERAGFTLADIPEEWEAFWTFWCDQVQPAVRAALGRDDIWGVGLPMSVASVDTTNGFWQFVSAYEADYVTRDGRLVIDDPEVRRRLVKSLDSYTAIYRNGCTPPDSVTWDAYSNNEQFLQKTILMTPNQTLSIVNALKRERPEDYYENAVTSVSRAVVFKGGGHVAAAKEFVSFLIRDGWLAHYLDFAGERMLPPMPALLQAPFWMDSRDPHRMHAAMQLLTQPRAGSYVPLTGDWRHSKVEQEESGRRQSTASPSTASVPSRRSMR